MTAEEYRSAMNVSVRRVLGSFAFGPLSHMWERASSIIKSMPQHLLDYISREPGYACGFGDFLITADSPKGLVGRFQIGILKKGHEIGKLDIIERIYFAAVPLDGVIPIGTVYTDEQLINLLTDSIERVVQLTLEGRRTGCRMPVDLIMNVKGRTTRLMLEALTCLSSGFDVVIVAHPASVAFDIADRVRTLSVELGIPCEMADENDLARHGDVPVIVTRPMGWTPEWTPARRVKPKVLFDHTARFERAGEWAMTKREREVFG